MHDRVGPYSEGSPIVSGCESLALMRYSVRLMRFGFCVGELPREGKLTRDLSGWGLLLTPHKSGHFVSAVWWMKCSRMRELQPRST